MSTLRLGLMIAAMTALLLVIGFAFGGKSGAMIAFVMSAGMNFFAYWNSDRMALAANGAVEVSDATHPHLVQMVRELAQRADIPMPRVYVIENDQPNAFATGRNPEHAAVAVHTGLMRRLSREELAGVIAHELAHIRNHDTLTMTITATIAGAISSIAHWGMFMGGRRDNGALGIVTTLLLVILAPIAAMLVQMAVSRNQEYEADRVGGLICGNPRWLASALAKIEEGVAAIPNEAAENRPGMAHMFIVNPLTAGGFDNLFSTHPNTGNRIAALEAQAASMNLAAAPAFGGPPPGASGRRRGPWG